MLRKLYLLITLALGAGVVACLFFGLRFSINYSSSIPKGLYLVENAPPSVGNYTLLTDSTILHFAESRGYILAGTAIGKKIVAGPGDTARVSQKGVFVNGVKIPLSKPLAYDSKGRKMSVCYGSVVLDSLHVFLMGHNPRSFDSRYFGPIKISSLKYTLQPVLTFN